jgi:hypothetical protein
MKKQLRIGSIEKNYGYTQIGFHHIGMKGAENAWQKEEEQVILHQITRY